MKTVPFRLAVLVALTAVPMFIQCSSADDAPAPQPAETGGAGGQADSAGDAVLICGKPATFSECDPVTAAPCDALAGETCDHAMELGGFKCFPPPNDAGAGDFCDNMTAFCGATTLCFVSAAVCQHYCCSDSDCVEGTCAPHLFDDGAASVGVCDTEFVQGGGGGAAGAGGTGP